MHQRKGALKGKENVVTLKVRKHKIFSKEKKGGKYEEERLQKVDGHFA